MADTVISASPCERLILDLSPESRADLERFLSEGGTGNVNFHVKDGTVLGAKIEAFYNWAPPGFVADRD